MAAKKKRDIDEAPLEAYGAEAIPIETSVPGSFVHGCDGEDAYLWWVRPGKKSGLRVTEVAPGLDKKSTRLRTIPDASKLTYTTKKTLAQLIAGWDKKLIGDLVPEDAGRKNNTKTRVVVDPVSAAYDDSDGESDVEDEDDEDSDGDDW